MYVCSCVCTLYEYRGQRMLDIFISNSLPYLWNRVTQLKVFYTHLYMSGICAICLWWLKWKWVPGTNIYECLIPNEWNCLARIKSSGLIGGGVSLGAGSEVSKVHAVPSSLSLPCACGSRGELLVIHPSPCLSSCCHALCHNVHGLSPSETTRPQYALFSIRCLSYGVSSQQEKSNYDSAQDHKSVSELQRFAWLHDHP